MEMVVVSPEYKVVIPSMIRKSLNVQPGQQFRVILYDNRIELILFRKIKAARGFLNDIDTTIVREDDRI